MRRWLRFVSSDLGFSTLVSASATFAFLAASLPIVLLTF